VPIDCLTWEKNVDLGCLGERCEKMKLKRNIVIPSKSAELEDHNDLNATYRYEFHLPITYCGILAIKKMQHFLKLNISLNAPCTGWYL